MRTNVPSWCDRILWKSHPETHIVCNSYGTRSPWRPNPLPCLLWSLKETVHSKRTFAHRLFSLVYSLSSRDDIWWNVLVCVCCVFVCQAVQMTSSAVITRLSLGRLKWAWPHSLCLRRVRCELIDVMMTCVCVLCESQTRVCVCPQDCRSLQNRLTLSLKTLKPLWRRPAEPNSSLSFILHVWRVRNTIQCLMMNALKWYR